MRASRAIALTSCCSLLAWLGCPAPADDDDTTAEGPPLAFTIPILHPGDIEPPVIGFDHDPVVQDGAYQLVCADYMERAFPHCYDEHDGSDFLLDGGFDAMDAGSSEVVAAAGGVVVAVEDGHYDHCHGELATMSVSCDGHEMIGNSVILEHASGHRTLYWHFMTDSIVVAEGDEVEAGEVLGWIGSSGMSSQPHLHFELRDPEGTSLDPYAGVLSQPESWWCEQGDPDGLPGVCAGG